MKVAIPFTAFLVTVPDKVPDPGFVFMAKVTLLVAVDTKLLEASSILTVTFDMVAPATVLAGWVPNVNLLGVEVTMLNVFDVAVVSAPLDATRVYPVPVLLILMFEKVASPATAA